jgi:hypothetical protein
VHVTFEGERIGTATISDNGILDMLITSPVLAANLKLGTIEHLSISTKLKE